MNRLRLPYRIVTLTLCASLALVGCPPVTNCPDPIFRDIVTAGDITRVCLIIGEYSVLAYVEADVAFDANGNANGDVHVMFEDGTEAVISFAGQEAMVTVGDTVVDLLATNAALGDMVQVNDELVSTDVLLASFQEEFTNSDVAGDWSATTQAIAAMAVLSRMDTWALNVEASRLLAITGFSCKLSCIVFGADVAIVLTLGCTALLAGCATATVVTIGGVAIPCTLATALCAGGVFAGTTAAYEAWLEFVWTP